jgi:hypothetical protein
MQKKLEYTSGNSHLAMLLKFWTFLHCKTAYLKGGNMTNIGFGQNFGYGNAMLV